MRTVAFVAQKGGCGKSTLAASVAVAAQADREVVFLVDLDPQRSLATWAQSRDRERLSGAAVRPGQLGAVLDSLASRGVSLAIVDTPACLSAASDTAIRAADLTIVPVRPTAFDLWSSEETWRRIRAMSGEGAFVLNQCPITRSTRRLQDAAGTVEAFGGLLQPTISARAAYQDAILRGLGPTEVDPEGEAAMEMRCLWRSIRRRLSDLHTGRRAAGRVA